MELVNRVAESDIEVFDLEALWDGRPVVAFDLAPLLVEGLVLRERPFREALQARDWSAYDGRHVAVGCATDAVVPTWAYMLVAAKLHGHAASVAFGTERDLLRDHFVRALEGVDWSRYAGKPVVVKGCGSAVVPPAAYLLATQKLQAVAAKLMYGEPCSAVPLWRRPKEEPPPVAAAKPAGVRPAGPPRRAPQP
jgi:hypothetical protein